MAGVLEGAALVCVLKLAGSAAFVPLVWTSRSPVSFCCCCLLLFTDLSVTLFLVGLWVCDPWLTPLRPVSSDLIALRFLLFLGHTYGAALALTTPLVAMEILARPRRVWLDAGGEEEEEEEEAGSLAGRTPEAPPPPGAVAVRVECEAGGWRPDRYQDQARGRPAHLVPGFLCCLLAWALSGLHGSLCVRRAEQLRAEACVRSLGSLPRCLPSLLTSTPPCWALLTLALLLVLTAGWALLLHAAHTPPAPAPEGLVDAGKTPGGRSVEKPRPQDQAWLSPCRQGNPSLALLPLGCQPADGGERGGQTYVAPPPSQAPPPAAGAEEDAHSDTHPPSWSRRWAGRGGVSWLGGGAWLGGAMAAALLLSVCVLPLSLSVNIVLVRGVEAALEWSAAPPCRDTRLTGVSQST